ncbi:four helix bundle protein [Candidatus Pacearchaeota archaeon]|nr:four helix bundle protein [Candidatus Pacearchaeota archaeon]
MWNYENLEVYHKAHGLIFVVYDLVKKFPASEKYDLVPQVRRAVKSISANIVEGSGKRTSKDFVGYLYNAIGSAKEVREHLKVAVGLDYLGEDEAGVVVAELRRIERMLVGYIEYVLGKDVK